MKPSERLDQIKAQLTISNPAIKEPFLSYRATCALLDECFDDMPVRIVPVPPETPKPSALPPIPPPPVK